MKQTSQTLNRRPSEQTWFLILMILSVVTMGVHLYLTMQHYQLKLGLAQSPAVCNVSSTFNCDAVGISRFATLFGIPMALLGLISQFIFFVLMISAKFNLSSSSDRIRRLLFWFSAFIFVVSLVMGFFSSVYLGTYCLFCIAVYVLSLLQLLAAWKIQESSPLPLLGSDLAGFARQSRWALLLVLLTPVFGWVAHSVILDSYGFGKMKLLVQDSLAQWEASPTQEFKPELGLTAQRTTGEAKMTIVEFADFLCPHCKSASPSLEAFTQAHPDVKLVFKAFPLDGKCNNAIEREGDGLRCKLTALVVCAETLAKKGWEAHHWVFERQENFGRGFDPNQMLEEATKDLGLEKAALDTCMNSDATQEAMLAQAQEGATAKIQGTPTVFVNGKKLPAGQFLPVLEAVYQKLK